AVAHNARMIAHLLKRPGHSNEVIRLHSTCHRTEPVWHVASRLHRRDVPESVLRWLLDPASLTRRIQSACHGCFRVEVLFQGWARPQHNEMRELGMRQGSMGFVREVHLLCDDLPWVFARTVIPRTTLTGPRRCLTRLKSRPLGAVLFADPSMQRGPVEIARLSPCDKLYPAAIRHLAQRPETIWGRRSLFTLGGKPLLVSEIFLPGISPCP
ncbi:MAG: chorismate lyase, partial [Pseudomonadota bacterium]